MKKLMISTALLLLVPTTAFGEEEIDKTNSSEHAEESSVKSVKGIEGVEETEVQTKSVEEGEEANKDVDKNAEVENGLEEQEQPTMQMEMSNNAGNTESVSVQGEVMLDEDITIEKGDIKEPINPMSYMWSGILAGMIGLLLWGYNKK